MLPTKILDRYRVTKGDNFKLKDYAPDDSGNIDLDKQDGQELLEVGVKRLSRLQQRLYAEGRWAVLMVLQGIDTAGKDGIIKHVLTGVNPQGVAVHSFKQPSHLELAHDYLWRAYRLLPMRGRIGIFNRSYYEDVLVVRVHKLVPESELATRFDRINDFEQLMIDAGVTIIKCFLHISKEEQKERLQARLDNPNKRWKFSKADIAERARWDDYQRAYEDALTRCNTKLAPWQIIPSDRKWYRNMTVSRLLRATLEKLNPQFPPCEEGLENINIH